MGKAIDTAFLVQAEEALSHFAGGFVAVSARPWGECRITGSEGQLAKVIAAVGGTYSRRMWHVVDEGNGAFSFNLAGHKVRYLVERFAVKAVS